MRCGKTWEDLGSRENLGRHGKFWEVGKIWEDLGRHEKIWEVLGSWKMIFTDYQNYKAYQKSVPMPNYQKPN